jgi:succinyl-diaminopimelate desuccinylase
MTDIVSGGVHQTGSEGDVARQVLHSEDLVELTAALVAVPSVSRAERELADLVERRLSVRAPALSVHRIGNNVVARTMHTAPGRQRIVFAGHLDTVPPSPKATGPKGGPDTVAGLGAVDMKGGLAVMLLLAEQAGRSSPGQSPATFVFYDKEEIGSRVSGMNQLFADHRDLVDGDFAVLLEPTGSRVEAGCQGNFVAELTFHGTRAHTARPWRGRNAIHRAAAALAGMAAYEPEPVEIDGLTYRQSLSVVSVQGGVQGNVVPDSCTVKVNYRHAPTVDADAALRLITGLAPDADEVRVLLSSPPAAPALGHPLAVRLCAAVREAPRPKLGWTDVGRFAAHGIPAVNFGPGDSEMAHTPGEFVLRSDLEGVFAGLRPLLLD